MTKKKKAIILATVVLVVVGAVVGVNLKNRRKKGTAVDLHKVGREDVVSRVSANGKVEAKRKVDVSANVMGQILNLAVREGDVVKKGQFLLQIDQAQLQAAARGSEAALAALMEDRAASKANLEQAEDAYARADKNFRQNIVSEAMFRQAATQRDGARAQFQATERRIEQARALLLGSRDSLSKTTLQSPIDGIVTALPVEEGEIAVIGTMNNAGTKLMTISDMSEVQADMEVDETDVPRVKLGQKATLTVDALPDQTFEGTVSEIASSPIVTPNGTNQAVEFSVKVLFKDPPATLRPGFSVSGDIDTGERKDVLAIPIQALVVQDLADKVKKAEGEAEEQGASTVVKKVGRRKTDVEGVFKVVDGKSKFIPVKTGLQGDLSIEVTDGVAAGDQVITGPFRVLRELKEGDLVHEKEKEKEKDKKAS